MKDILIGLLGTGFVYFLFASSNKSFDTFDWNWESLYFFGCIICCIWRVILITKYLNPK